MTIRFNYFNPRSHKGSDNEKYLNDWAFDISIHAPTRGATDRTILIEYADIFQSTLPQGERPCCGHEQNIFYAISIHAPTRGATQIQNFCTAHSTISIHAPTRGATVDNFYDCYSDGFQSTLPQGERPRNACIMQV